MICISGHASFCDLDESERFEFAYCRRDGGAVDAILHELVERDGQLAVVIAAVVYELDLNTRHNPVRR
jgi:hypothetical protein